MVAVPYGVAAPGAALWVMLSFAYVILLHLVAAAQLLGMWFTFKKMGMPGWKGLIPFYNTYVLCEKLWEVKYFWRIIVFTIIGAVSMLIGEILLAIRETVAPPGTITGLVLMLVALAFMIIFLVMLVLAFVMSFKIYHKLARGFGLKTAWVWGMLFVPYIMFPIIGFNKSIVYLEPVGQEE